MNTYAVGDRVTPVSHRQPPPGIINYGTYTVREVVLQQVWVGTIGNSTLGPFDAKDFDSVVSVATQEHWDQQEKLCAFLEGKSGVLIIEGKTYTVELAQDNQDTLTVYNLKETT